MKRHVKGWLLFLLIFGLIPFATLAILWRDVCVTHQVAESPSPDGRAKAGIFATDCRGRLKPATEVRVAIREQEIHKTPERILLYQGSELPEITWSAPGALRVLYPKGAEIVSRKSNLSCLLIEIGEKSL